jgi:hypothetical protein
MKTNTCKLIVAAVLLALAFAAPVDAGVIGKSLYDKVVDIYVTTCDGNTVVYRDCVITNVGQWVVAFMPDQGRIPTGKGKEIIVHKTTCNSVVMVEK